jgi:hypothetical protein
LKNMARPEASPAHTTITSFARSTPTVVISFLSSPFLMQIEAHNSILALDAVRLTSSQGRGTPLYSSNVPPKARQIQYCIDLRAGVRQGATRSTVQRRCRATQRNSQRGVGGGGTRQPVPDDRGSFAKGRLPALLGVSAEVS